jgi:Flp pilus assembly protein TadD
MLGGCLAQKKDLDGAIAEFKAAMRINPDNPAPHVGLGMALQEKKQYEAAFQEFGRALALDPSSEFVRARYDYLAGFLDKK